MPIAAAIKPNLYKDSVALMRVSERILSQADIQRATLLMGTPANKGMLHEAGLWLPEMDAARANDIIIVVEALTDAAIEVAHDEIARALAGDRSLPRPAQAALEAPQSMALGVADDVDIAVAQISVPGPYAAAEAMKALKLGMHVFLFSDNVPLEQELALKTLARKKNLLVMGPDCGTAIIRGVPLGFANVVRQGAIGLIGASGTGLQEVSCQIDALGQGVSHVIGTGGRDMYAEIGGVTMHQAIDLLAADAATRVIGIVSKSPAPAVARTIVEHAQRAGKPCVVLFLGAELENTSVPTRVVRVATLVDAAHAAVALALNGRVDPVRTPPDDHLLAVGEVQRFAPTQRLLCGLYSGGTFCTEAQLIWRALGLRVDSNIPLDPAATLTDGPTRNTHVAIDFGADEFTVGRPHPMIDMSNRIRWLAREAQDPAVAAVILDVVLGYGSHDDPAGALAPAIVQAIAVAAREGRHLSVVSFVCGTEADPQQSSLQQAKLRAAGALVMSSSTAAARLAGAIAMGAAKAAPDCHDLAVSQS